MQLVPRHMLRPIRPSIDPGAEHMVASGPCRIIIWDAPGDGSYNSVGVPMLFTGTANSTGIAYGVGAAAGSMAVNLMGKRRAQQDSQQRWMDYIPHGTATVSTHGFYVESQEHGLLTWGWGALRLGRVDRAVRGRRCSCRLEEGTARVRFLSDWAELAFISWVEVCHPQHPGKYTWFSPEWVERVRALTGTDPFTDRLRRRAHGLTRWEAPVWSSASHGPEPRIRSRTV